MWVIQYFTIGTCPLTFGMKKTGVFTWNYKKWVSMIGAAWDPLFTIGTGPLVHNRNRLKLPRMFLWQILFCFTLWDVRGTFIYGFCCTEVSNGCLVCKAINCLYRWFSPCCTHAVWWGRFLPCIVLCTHCHSLYFSLVSLRTMTPGNLTNIQQSSSWIFIMLVVVILQERLEV